MAERIDKVRERLAERIARTVEREAALGRDGFLSLPQRHREQLALLQKQAEPRDEGLEALLASEHNLDAYEAKLQDALNLQRQLSGEAGRQRSALRRRGRRWLIAGAIGVAALGGGGLYLRSALADKAAYCADSAACEQSGDCGSSVSLSGGPAIVCAPRDDEDCAQSVDCDRRGRCRKLGLECGAASDADCERLTLCTERGFCTARDGECVPAKVQDCRPTKGCTDKGLCTPIDGHCRAGSDADCRQSEACREVGACIEVAGECVPPPDSFGDAGAGAADAEEGAP